jgi:hypothetical protein
MTITFVTTFTKQHIQRVTIITEHTDFNEVRTSNYEIWS